MPWIDVDQLSPDWLKMRVGCFTASHSYDTRKLKNGNYSADRNKYLKAKVAEQLTGFSMETYTSPYMEQGLEIEPLAVAAYEMERNLEVGNGGIFAHDVIPRFLASPDGRVGEDGLIEIKYLSGNTTDANHFDMLDGADIPIEYQMQMDAQLSCSGRKWVDFISYYPTLPARLRMEVRRYPRDEAKLNAIEIEVEKFLLEFAEMVKRIGDRRLVAV